ncbi:MAG: adenylate/guanylate cyclase domain-containing protein, partial [Methylococcaceae bacterium]
SILDIALKHGIPHRHICGGNARCSTCRIIVEQGLENVLPRNDIEQLLAEKKGMERCIRLACQTRIKGPVTLRRLVMDDLDADLAMDQQGKVAQEQSIAILFSDIRGFTDFSERHLPYDVIHILNRYFQEMGAAVIDHHGYIDKYIGDGLMALFGIDESNALTNCINAISAAFQMMESLEKVNRYLKHNFNESFEIGIGIHYGSVVLGNIGHHGKVQYTAIGDTVNVASRIEQQTKHANTPILISEAMYIQIKDQIRTGKVLNTALKGKKGLFNLYEVLGF